MDELINTVEIVEIMDGVRARHTGTPLVIETLKQRPFAILSSGGGEGVAVCVVSITPLVGEEILVGVMEVVGEEGNDGVSEGSGSERGDVWGVRTSLRGMGLVNKLVDGCEVLGRMNDISVSKLLSSPSGTPLKIVLDGAGMEGSNNGRFLLLPI